MNREIKFRAWDKRNNKFADYFDLTFNPQQEQGCHIDSVFHEHNEQYQNYNNENVILMQYTGLKDKNGVDIYEGDVMSINHKTYTYKVVFENGSFKLYHLKDSLAEWGLLSRIHEMKFEELEFEVIGNIHQNPELLND